MKLFRSHITKTPGIIALLLGFVLHLSQPVQEANPHNAFTSWLDGHLKSDDEDNVRRLIRELGSEEEQLEKVIRKASEVVATHADDFELPFSSSDQEDVFRLLITEWNAYQNASQGMGKAVILENNKPHAINKDAKVLIKSGALASAQVDPVQFKASQGTEAGSSPALLSPLESGIAINAP